MRVNRKIFKRNLTEETKRFITDNIAAIETLLGPTIEEFGHGLAQLDGPRGEVIRRSFAEARTAWEKYFWAALGRGWVGDDLRLEEAVMRAEKELLALSKSVEAVVVWETLEATAKVNALVRYESDRSTDVGERRLSVTKPIIEAYVEDDSMFEPDPTEKVERVEAPMIASGMCRTSGPEDTTVVERYRDRPAID